MELNLDAYGAGLGLVMLGWMVGLVVSYAFSTVSIIGRINART